MPLTGRRHHNDFAHFNCIKWRCAVTCVIYRAYNCMVYCCVLGTSIWVLKSNNEIKGVRTTNYCLGLRVAWSNSGTWWLRLIDCVSRKKDKPNQRSVQPIPELTAISYEALYSYCYCRFLYHLKSWSLLLLLTYFHLHALSQIHFVSIAFSILISALKYRYRASCAILHWFHEQAWFNAGPRGSSSGRMIIGGQRSVEADSKGRPCCLFLQRQVALINEGDAGHRLGIGHSS